jgi:type II secretory pathway pseudopilin PulG
VIEILVVVGIIAMLAGLLMPAVHTVQKMARETKQKAQFTAIELGLAAFKSDYGDYPPSDWFDPSISGTTPGLYCGAQKLAEAMLGWDLLGFHPESAWRADGLAAGVGNAGIANTVYFEADTLKKRKSRYVELDTANPFLLGGGVDALFPGAVGSLAPRTYVLCDVFGRTERKVQLADGKMATAGTPILYYKANPASLLHDPVDWQRTSACIYDARDNAPIVSLGWLGDATKAQNLRRQHPLAPDIVLPNFEYFYNYTLDKKVAVPRNAGALVRRWPVRPDSYLLISAGMDGLYGTDDDICNFGR